MLSFIFEVPTSRKRNEERSSSNDSRKNDRAKSKKEKKIAKRSDSRDSKNPTHPMDEDEVPVHAEVPVPGTLPVSATAAASEAINVLTYVSDGDVFRLVQCMVKPTEQMQSQIGKIGDLSTRREEFELTRLTPLPKWQGWRGRLDSLGSRIVQLEDNFPV